MRYGRWLRSGCRINFVIFIIFGGFGGVGAGVVAGARGVGAGVVEGDVW